MLRTRLWMGALLIAAAAGVLVVDQRFEPWYPFLLLLVLGLSLLACFELRHLLGAGPRPPAAICYTAVSALVLANWPAHLARTLSLPWDLDPWHWISGVFAGVVLAAFLVEMATFREPGGCVTRIALAVWIAAYLGLLPSFLLQLRWQDGPADGGGNLGTLALALAIFVPKSCDIGAYFTGRLLGRHRMTPVLSPKKTWEGAAGGLTTSVLAAIGIHALGPVFRGGAWAAAGFGLTVGLAGMLGDLAESLIKRDCRRKDASQVVPGFGGVLDVVDAVLFAAPVAYWWLHP
jgi:phosphatidate cytidylyltransferase